MWSGITCAADTPSASASSRRGSPSAIAGWAISRASWPPPMTASVGARCEPVEDTTGAYRRAARAWRPAGAGSAHDGAGRGLEAQAASAVRGDQGGVAGVVVELATQPAEV